MKWFFVVFFKALSDGFGLGIWGTILAILALVALFFLSAVVSALSCTFVIEPLIRKAKGDAKYDLPDSVYLPLAFVIFIASLVIILQNVPL